MEETIDYLRERTDGVHLSLDLDGVGSSRCTRSGDTGYWWYKLSGESFGHGNACGIRLITSAEFVEVNPILDEQNKTAIVAVALMGSLFGEKLL